MELNTLRAKAIDKYIQDHPDCEELDYKLRVRYNGDDHVRPVYRIPFKLLIYNIRNGRFKAELLEKEETIGRELDPINTSDANIIQKLLLEQDDNETKVLREDIEEHGQIEPGIITFDGAVINANRRMAILSKLFKDTRNTKYSFLRVGRLPKGVDNQDIWRIEAGLQFGKDFRLKYGGINELLKLKEGIKQGLTSKDISVALLGRYNVTEVDEKLEILKLVDSYLNFINKTGEYHLIHDEGKLEHFISAYKSNTPLKKQGKIKEAAILTTMAFLLINKTKIRHLDIRELRKIATNDAAFKELTKDIKLSNPLKISSEKVNENFNNALDIAKADELKGKPERLLKKALSLVKNVNVEHIKSKKSSLKELLNELEEYIKKLQTSLKK